jgi:hypothetical protein
MIHATPLSNGQVLIMERPGNREMPVRALRTSACCGAGIGLPLSLTLQNLFELIYSCLG